MFLSEYSNTVSEHISGLPGFRKPIPGLNPGLTLRDHGIGNPGIGNPKQEPLHMESWKQLQVDLCRFSSENIVISGHILALFINSTYISATCGTN